MKQKRVMTTMMLVLGVVGIYAQDSTLYLSLKQSCQMGIEKNADVQNAVLDQRKTAYQFKEAQSKLYPQIEGYSSFNYYYAIPKMLLPGEIFGQTGLIPVEIGTKFDWNSGFKASQVLYSQSYFTSVQLARRMTSMGDLTIQAKKEEVVYQISKIYYLCLTTEKQMEQLGKTMQNTNRLLEISKLQSENGIIRKVDYSRVVVNKSNLQTQIDNLNQLYQQQLTLLKYLAGVNLTSKVALSDSLVFSPETIAQQVPGFDNRTELKVLDKQEEITRLTQKFNRQSYLPTLSGIGQYYYQGQRNEFDFFNGGNDKFFRTGFIGLSLNLPIFDGFEKRWKTKQQEVELLKLKNTKENTAAYLTKEYLDAISLYNNGIQALLRQQENIKIAEEAYDISLQGYRQQVVPLSDLLLSDNSLTEARLSYFNAFMQLKNAQLDVKRAKGELLN